MTDPATPATPVAKRFGISTSLIRHLIDSQAGTLEKALMEAVMNAVDAGASQVDVTLNREGFTVRDNGRGFRNLDEVEAYFGTFGFDHDAPGEAGKRTYGRFGIGRGQMWKFATTRWHTNTLLLDVDIRTRGLDYIVTEGQPDADGTLITGTYYTPMTTTEVIRAVRGFTDLVRYSIVPVTLDGKVVSTDPRTQKWTLETDDAWIRFTDGGGLRLFNLGMFVAEIPEWRSEGSGVVVTKPGRMLEVNMARNDVAEGDAVWRRIKAAMRDLTTDKLRKNTRLTESDLQALTRRLRGREAFEEADLAVLSRARLITDTRGKSHTIRQFVEAVGERTPVTMHDQQRANLSTYLHEQKLAYVLHPKTLTRWHAQDPAEILSVLVAFTAERRAARDTRFGLNYQFSEQGVSLSRPFGEVARGHDDALAHKPHADTSPQERALLAALHAQVDEFRAAVHRFCNAHDQPFPYRKEQLRFAIGVADTCTLWKDEHHTVFIEEREVTAALKTPDSLGHLLSQISLLTLQEGRARAGDDGTTSDELALAFLTGYAPLTTLCLTTIKVYVEHALKLGAALPRPLLTALGRIERLSAADREPQPMN